MAIDTGIGLVKNPIKVLDFGASEKEWLEARKPFVGGSEASIALGVSPFQSKLAYILEKTGVIEGFSGNEFTYWGSKLEDIILEECKTRFFSGEDDLTDFKVAMCKHPKIDYMSANVDGLGYSKEMGRVIIEAKNVGSIQGRVSWDNGNVPTHYYSQVQHYMCVMGEEFEVGIVCALFNGNHYETRIVERSNEFIKELLEAEKELWARVQEKRFKDLVDDSPATEKALNKLYSKHIEETLVTDDPEVLEFAKLYLKCNEELKALDTKKREAKSYLKEFLGEKTEAILDGFIVKWKPTLNGSRRFEVKKEG